MIFRKKPEPAPVAPVQTIAFPLGVNIGDQPKIDHAHYRLNAIVRHIEQNDTPAHKLAEFASEARVHLANLLHVKALGEDEAQAIARKIGVK